MFFSFRSARLQTAAVLTTLALFGSLSAAAQTLTKQWDHSFGGGNQDYLTALQLTPDGGYVLAGTSYSGLGGDKSQSSRGDFDYWVVKVDAHHTKQWDTTVGGRFDDMLRAIQPTPDGGYLLGGESFSGISGEKTQPSQAHDYWLVKLDANGQKQWDKTIGGEQSDYLRVIEPTVDGGYLLAGSSTSGIGGDKSQASQGGSDYWLVKMDQDGNVLWDRTYGGSSSESLDQVKPTRDGGYILGGSSASGISGDKSQPAHGNWDYWVVKVDANGVKQWDKTFGGTSTDFLNVLQPTLDGGYLLGGDSESGSGGNKSQDGRGRMDYWVVKLDAQGTQQWDKRFGGNSEEHLTALQCTPEGEYLLGGSSYSGLDGDKSQASRGGSDQWFIKLDAAGNKLWDTSIGGTLGEDIASLQPTRDGGYLAAGSSVSGSGGDKSQPSRGGSDYWVVKLTAGSVTATAAPTSKQRVEVYPNPARTSLRLQLPNGAPRTGLQVSLLDGTGHTVWTQSLIPRAGGIAVAISPQPAGLYLLRVEGPNGFVATQRVVLE